MSTILTGLDWSPILGTLVAIIGGLFAWLANSIKKKNDAAAAESKAIAAGMKLAAIGVALLQKGWAHIGPEVQTALADGKVSDEERKVIEASVTELVKEVTDSATLEEIGSALGLPFAGIIAKIASFLIEKWTEAHDPSVPTSSPNTFPTPSMVLNQSPADPSNP